MKDAEWGDPFAFTRHSNIPPHTCTCMVCQPDLIGAAEPLCGTLAVKWGTLGPHIPGVVYLDGKPIEYVYELQEGADGYVLCYRGPHVHMCMTCGLDACAERLRGAVELRTGDPHQDPSAGVWDMHYWRDRKPWH